MPPSPIPIPAAGFSLEELDGDLLLFNAADGRLLDLNSTAALVWQLCDGTRSMAAIIALLSDAYPDAAENINEDVPHILADLRRFGALEF